MGINYNAALPAVVRTGRSVSSKVDVLQWIKDLKGVTALIRAIFKNLEVGFAYDPNDLSTMFRDAAGTVPVTGAGQPVGLMLDKSKGLVLGNELITNGNFSNGLSGWSVQNGTGVIVNGAARITATSTAQPQLYMPTAFLAGKYVEISVDFMNRTGGTGVFVGIYSEVSGSVASVISSNTARGVKLKVLIPPGFSGGLYCRLNSPTAGSYVDFDNVSIKEITGNHAYQTDAASRPLLGRHPASGVRNLVRNSYDVYSSTWGRSGVTITAAGLGINGNPCYNVNPAGGALSWLGPNIVSLTTGQIVTTSFYAKKGTGARSKIIFENQPTNWNNVGVAEFDLIAGTSNGVGTSMTPVRDGWYRCSVTRTVGNSVPNRVVFFVDLYGNGIAGNDVNISDVQVEVSTTATTYQTVHSVMDITEAGVTSINNLYFDGIDDFLQTNNINFTATDKISLFAGVRKLSDASIGIVVETTTNSASSTGNFLLAAPTAGGVASYGFRSKGSSGQFAEKTGYAAPNSAVLTGSASISSSMTKVRINGTEYQNTSDQGGGTYSNAQMYIGRRAGVSLPFNGHIYGLIGIGKLTSDSETAAIEKELAKRTGVTLNV